MWRSRLREPAAEPARGFELKKRRNPRLETSRYSVTRVHIIQLPWAVPRQGWKISATAALGEGSKV
jgi:hypothetical protein